MNNIIVNYPFKLYTNNLDISDEYIQNILSLFNEAWDIFINQLQFKNPLQEGIYYNKGARYIQITIKDIPIQRGLVAANVQNEAIQITLHKNLKKNTATPLHELFHVFQYNYSDINNMWFMEGLARWSQNLIQKRKMKNETLPQNKDELATLLYKKHEAEYFWRKLFEFIEDEKLFVKLLFEELSKYNIENKKDLKNNYIILDSTLKIINKIGYKQDNQIDTFLTLIENIINENKQFSTPNYDIATDTYIENIEIKTQNDLKEYKNIKYIQGNLEINSTNLDNIDSFYNLKEVSGYIKIINNKKLKSIKFLKSLQIVGSSLYLHNNSLENLQGLEQLQTIGASLSLSNNKLQNLKELKNLTTINGMLNLYNNDLVSLDGLENLQTIKTVKWNKKVQTLNISLNKNLKDIKALKNIQTYDNYIIIYFDKEQKWLNKPSSKSSFCKNILEFVDAKTMQYIPTFKLFDKVTHDYKNFRKTTHNKLLTHLFDFEIKDVNTLVISFVGFNGFLGGVFYNKYPLITDNINTHKIFIHDKNNSWYHSGIPNFTNNIIQTVELIKKLTSFKQYKHIVCFGASMGAYMALLVGKIIKANKIVAFAPQTFLDKENRVKYQENRWISNLDKIPQNIDMKYLDLDILYQDGCDDIDIQIHYAKDNTLDMKHIDHLKAPCIKKIGYDIDSHYVSIYLRDTKQIDGIILSTLQLQNSHNKLINLNKTFKRKNVVKWPYSSSIVGMTEYITLFIEKGEILPNTKKSMKELLYILTQLENYLTTLPENKALNSINDAIYYRLCDSLKQFILNHNINQMYIPIDIWKFISSVMILNQYFLEYLKINEKIYYDIYNLYIENNKQILKYKEYINISEKDFISYCFENNYEHILADKTLNHKYKELFALGSLYYEKQQQCINYYQNTDQFASYIKNKSIAIVGPANNTQCNGQEIDSYDIVIRFNFKNLNGFDKKTYGTKTNISYYVILNQKNIDDLNLEENYTHINKLQYFISTDTLYFKILQQDPKLQLHFRSRLLVHSTKRNPYLNGSANAVQKCLFDILRFQPKKVKIFNADLWISNINKHYLNGKIKTKYFAWHDPLSNFIFLKKLFEHNIIEADNILSSVLTISKEEYIKTLHTIYGKN